MQTQILASRINNSVETSPKDHIMESYYIGLGLAISSSLLIGSSFILKKVALNRLSQRGIRAGDGGFGYLTDWVWWLGMSLMIGGEIINFTAYAFAPATLVTPLGILSVLVSTILSSKFLNENLNLIGKLGCLMCMTGTTMIVIHAPKEQFIKNMAEVEEKLLDFAFLVYVSLIIVLGVITIFFVSPSFGQRNPLVYLYISGSIGSLTVMLCKVLGVAIKETLNGTKNQFTNWITWIIMFLLLICISTQMNYLNKALDVFDTSIVTPLLYVVFTTFVIIASAILFKEWLHMRAEDVLGILCGFLTIIVAVFILQAFKDLKISWHNLNMHIMRSSSSSTSEANHYTSVVSIDNNDESDISLLRNGERERNIGVTI